MRCTERFPDFWYFVGSGQNLFSYPLTACKVNHHHPFAVESENGTHRALMHAFPSDGCAIFYIYFRFRSRIFNAPFTPTPKLWRPFLILQKRESIYNIASLQYNLTQKTTATTARFWHNRLMTSYHIGFSETSCDFLSYTRSTLTAQVS